ncbi:MAG: RnfABCDGE type electron transport complex subunit D [Gammaproteobacteria bacterium]|nr:RnfABCDGE type electron transport complex subunit D [Gammaproteobacteria bacterium]
MHKYFISSPHRHDGSSVRHLMLSVCFALIPGLLTYIWFFGWGIVIQCLLAVGFALAAEYLALRLRKRPVTFFLKDGSAVLTGLLFALSISPFSPWYISFFGILVAILFAKHIYGGLGQNLFNPAMVGYVFVLLCFPADMTNWPLTITQPPAISTYFTYIFTTPENLIDGISGATALDQMKTQLGSMGMVSEIKLEPAFGQYGGAGWEWIACAYLFGGLALTILGLIRWHIPVAVLLAIFLFSLFFHLYDSDIYPSPLFHIFSGGTILCAFFIATDPVSASTSAKGKILYGGLIGVLCFSIRTWGSYPDGIAFAILVANACVPLIDHYTRPRVLGEFK